MITYNYHIASSLEDASKVLAEYKDAARIVAGGTDIMVQVHEKDKRWKNLKLMLDITPLHGEIGKIYEDGDKIHVGALCTHTEIETSPIIQKYVPYLGVACSTVGSPQIRNRGTIGGSIGNAFPASDPLPALVASDAAVVIYSAAGERTVLLKDLYEGKGQLSLAPGEFLKEFVIEKFPEGTKTAFSKLGRRKALAISRLNCAAALTFDGNGVITRARICPGCIFIVPDRVERAEQLLIGEKPSEELFEEAGKAVADVMIERTGVRWSTEYKQPAVQEIVYKALCGVCGLEA